MLSHILLQSLVVKTNTSMHSPHSRPSHLKQRSERSPEVANECLMSIFGHGSSSPQECEEC